jgi:hypothetical protein
MVFFEEDLIRSIDNNNVIMEPILHDDVCEECVQRHYFGGERIDSFDGCPRTNIRAARRGGEGESVSKDPPRKCKRVNPQ